MNVYALLGPLAILITWLTYAFLYLVRDKSAHTTLSEVGAIGSRNYIIFCSGLLASGIIVFLFIRLWFVDALQLPPVFLYIAGIAALVLQPIIAIVPMRGKVMARMHDTAAYIESALLPIMAFMIARSSVLPVGVRLVCLALTLFMVYLVFEFWRNFLKPRFILVQIAFGLSFHLIILISTTSKLITG